MIDVNIIPYFEILSEGQDYKSFLFGGVHNIRRFHVYYFPTLTRHRNDHMLSDILRYSEYVDEICAGRS